MRHYKRKWGKKKTRKWQKYTLKKKRKTVLALEQQSKSQSKVEFFALHIDVLLSTHYKMKNSMLQNNIKLKIHTKQYLVPQCREDSTLGSVMAL